MVKCISSPCKCGARCGDAGPVIRLRRKRRTSCVPQASQPHRVITDEGHAEVAHRFIVGDYCGSVALIAVVSSTVVHCLRVFLTSADHVHVATRDGHKIFLLTSSNCEFAYEKLVVLSVDTDQPHAPASYMSGRPRHGCGPFHRGTGSWLRCVTEFFAICVADVRFGCFAEPHSSVNVFLR